MIDYASLPTMSQEPYPQIFGALFSPQTIRILRDLNSGKVGEMTAVASYVYQELVFADTYPEISSVLERIGRVEMEHMELLGRAILEFGGDPIYASGNGAFWSGRFADSTRNLKRALQNNIIAETEAIAEYTNAARTVENKSLADLLLRIAEDEMLHKKALETILYSLD